jgi:two-component system NarL family response regulator
MTDAAVRIVLADDHPVVRAGIASILADHPDLLVVGQAGTGRELIDLYHRERPDVALVDLRMPDTDGVEAIGEIRRRSPDARLIVLTTFDGDEDIYRALRAGAKAYLLKDVPRDELLACVRAVHRGEPCLRPAIAAKLTERLGSEPLTARELDVLRLMAAGQSNKQIAAALYITEGTVKVHASRVFDKLGVSDRTQAATTALRRGIVRPTDTPAGPAAG